MIWWTVLLLFLRYILLLFLEVSPGEEAALWAADALPRGQGNWKCSRTSCSWETFCLVVCTLEVWLLAFSPILFLGDLLPGCLCPRGLAPGILAQTFGLWQGQFFVSVFVHVLVWVFRRFRFVCVEAVQAAQTAWPRACPWTHC